MLKKSIGLLALSSLFVLSSCSDDATNAYVVKDSDVVDTHGEIDNQERFEQFFEHVQQGKDDTIRIVRYTIEGDPILHDYQFENNEIQVTIDNKYDSYGEAEIFKTTCKTINEKKGTKNIIYTLDGCTSPNEMDTEILTVAK